MSINLAIWNYALLATRTQVIESPHVVKFLTVQTRHDSPMLWVLVDKESPLESYTVHIVGTGGENVSHIADLQYVGTFQLRGANYQLNYGTFHVFI